MDYLPPLIALGLYAVTLACLYRRGTANRRTVAALRQALKAQSAILAATERHVEALVADRKQQPFRDPFDDADADREPLENDTAEHCVDCGAPSRAIDNGLCPMCFELTGGSGHE